MSSRLWGLALSVLSLAGVSIAQSADVPLTNWTVPPYRGSSASGGVTAMTDISPGIGFVAMQPCRIVDTRGGGVFVGAYGPPALVANATRNFDINSAAHCTGIPSGVEAYSLNFTVVTTTGGPGDLRAWPTGNPPVQTTSVLNWTTANVIIANATIIGAGTGGQIDVTAAGFGTQLLIDINGYFTDTHNAETQFLVAGTVAANGAIQGINFSAVDLSAGVRGDSVTGRTFGVWGETASSTAFAGGVVGVASSTTGLAVGTWGQTASNTSGAIGVFGDTLGTTGPNYGVYGLSRGFANHSAGVFGVDFSGVTAAIIPSAGVRGESLLKNGVVGVTGQNGFSGVTGVVVDSNGNAIVSGSLGVQAGADDYGVYSHGDAHVAGTFTATTNKGFVQPHPFDASKEIRYISLEGPHTEVYFRGTAQVSQGITRIPIPQHFRFVADPATYSTLVTPVGDMATVAVVSEGDGGIVVRASRNVKVHYVVFAERAAVRNPDPIIENVHFRPDPDRDLLAHLPDSFRELLIQNGTLNPDGTVNMETARRLGWDKEWEKRARPAPQPTVE